jgi:hypothetical protein
MRSQCPNMECGSLLPLFPSRPPLQLSDVWQLLSLHRVTHTSFSRVCLAFVGIAFRGGPPINHSHHQSVLPLSPCFHPTNSQQYLTLPPPKEPHAACTANRHISLRQRRNLPRRSRSPHPHRLYLHHSRSRPRRTPHEMARPTLRSR